MSETFLIWGLALIAAGVLLVVVEVLVPSGGLITFAAAACAIAGVVSLFRYSPAWGLIGLLAVVVLVPAAVGFGLHIWPSTPIGRRMMGAKTPEERESERLAEEEERRRWQSLIGREGVAVTELRPVGVVRIDGVRYDALAETTMITAGQRVRVTVVEGRQVKVRAIA